MSDKYIYQQDGSIKKWIEKPDCYNIGIYEQSKSCPKCLKYDEIMSLPSIPAKTIQGYKEGDVLVEGVDFVLKEQWLLSYGQGAAWYDSNEYPDFEGYIQERRQIALPLKKEQSNAGDENVWIDVKDGLPDMGEVVWVKHTHGNKPALAWINYQNVWQAVTSTGGVEDFNDCFNYDFNENPITHYQLLNQP